MHKFIKYWNDFGQNILNIMVIVFNRILLHVVEKNCKNIADAILL